MRCPILEIGWMQTKIGDKGQSSDCLKEECAWWHRTHGKCVIHNIAMNLENLTAANTLLCGKLAHEEQFRK